MITVSFRTDLGYGPHTWALQPGQSASVVISLLLIMDEEFDEGDTLNTYDRLVDVIIIFPILFRADCGSVTLPVSPTCVLTIIFLL